MLNPRLLILPLALLLFGFSAPTEFADAETGLAIDPPTDYMVLPLPPDAASSAKVLLSIFRYDANLESPQPPFCVLALHSRADNAERTQTELNARMRDTGRLANMIETFNGTYTVIADEAVELQGVAGHQFTMQDKAAAGGPADLLQVSTTFDTPEGRITLNCAALRGDLVSDLVSFGLIRESITLP